MEKIISEIIVGVISALVGGFIGFKIGVNKKQSMKQKSGNNSQQIQVGEGNVNIGK